MSLVSGPKLKTPWAIKNEHYLSGFGIFATKEEEYALEYILSNDWYDMGWFKIYNKLKMAGIPIKISDDYTKIFYWIKYEWERCGSIVPNKRMVLIEKRK